MYVIFNVRFGNVVNSNSYLFVSQEFNVRAIKLRGAGSEGHG